MAGIGGWLKSIGLPEYEQEFLQEGYDDVLIVPYLTEHDLAIMGRIPIQFLNLI